RLVTHRSMPVDRAYRFRCSGASDHDLPRSGDASDKGTGVHRIMQFRENGYRAWARTSIFVRRAVVSGWKLAVLVCVAATSTVIALARGRAMWQYLRAVWG